MEERGNNKTIMCSVFFLDIVGYSKKSVAGQISLKERFNSYLSAAIRDVPITDRIILDTGDGAAINFMGDIEDALKAAISLRKSVLDEDPAIDHPLLVRMGINLGPVRLVRDINGQPNIVGDGINVAQRVMSFADASQILVSRSYYDAVSRISQKYAGMFHYQGSRTDKHVREHEVYAIGYPGDKTTLMRTARLYSGQPENPLGKAFFYANEIGHLAVKRLNDLMGQVATRFRRAEPMQRVIYVGVGTIPLLLLIVSLVNLVSHNEIPAMPTGPDELAINTTEPNSAVPASPALVVTDVEKESSVKSQISSKSEIERFAENNKSKAKPKLKSKIKRSEGQPEATAQNADAKQSDDTLTIIGGTDAYLTVRCLDGTEVFLDGTKKGRISGSILTIKGPLGEHTVIASHPSGVDSRKVVLEAGKIVQISPTFCN